MYPQIIVDLKKIAHNTHTITNLCMQYGIEVTAITKVVCGDPVIGQLLAENGISKVGDSRIANLRKMAEIPVEKWLIRPPMPDEAALVIAYSDVSMNTELDVVKRLNEEAKKQGKMHKIILMIEMGDIREGIWDMEEIVYTVNNLKTMSNIELVGVGTSLACFSFIKPDKNKMNQLLSLTKEIEAILGKLLPIISCGNSASINMMLSGCMESRLNNFRLGESLFWGKERESFQQIYNTYSDVFTLKAQIIEIKTKPSLPWGELGMDSYGKRKYFVDKGKRRRAILAVGKQDIDIEFMKPKDNGIEIVGASSDHLVIDVSCGKEKYKVGDIVEFELGYYATMRAFTSEFVEKRYIQCV